MSRVHGWTRRLGFLLGIALVAAVTMGTRVPAASGTAGADVTIAAASTGELAVTPTGPFARGLDLEPGRSRQPARGTVSVRNSTGSAADVRVRLLRSIHDLDALLQVEVTADGHPVYSGPLGGLQSWSTASFRLGRGGHTALAVSASLPASARTGYQGRIADLSLEFSLQSVGA